MILMTVRWTSSSYPNAYILDDLIFQHLLYTIKFKPSANVLFADLVASQSDIIRDETLILDASSSYISNMPEALQRRSLAYIWECPAILDSYCQTRAGSQLSIPFSQVEKSTVVYEQPYTFKVTVIWAKPDGEDDKTTLSVDVTWFNLVMPDFNIDFDPALTRITSS